MNLPTTFFCERKKGIQPPARPRGVSFYDGLKWVTVDSDFLNVAVRSVTHKRPFGCGGRQYAIRVPGTVGRVVNSRIFNKQEIHNNRVVVYYLHFQQT